MKNIIKKLEKIAEKHGAENLEEVVKKIYCTDGGVSTQGDPPLTCGPNQVYNEILKKCVDDIG